MANSPVSIRLDDETKERFNLFLESFPTALEGVKSMLETSEAFTRHKELETPYKRFMIVQNSLSSVFEEVSEIVQSLKIDHETKVEKAKNDQTKHLSELQDHIKLKNDKLEKLTESLKSKESELKEVRKNLKKAEQERDELKSEKANFGKMFTGLESKLLSEMKTLIQKTKAKKS